MRSLAAAEHVFHVVTRMVATEFLSNIEKIARLLMEKGFSVTTYSIREKDLFNESREFELLKAVSASKNLVLFIRVSRALDSRIHVYYRGSGTDLEEIADKLESLGFSIDVDERELTASTRTVIEEASRIISRLIDVFE